MKTDKIIIASFLALITTVGVVIATECYGTTKDNAPSGIDCKTTPCSYNCESPTYQVCTSKTDPTGNTCSTGPNLNKGITETTYSNGTCVGYKEATTSPSPGTPEVLGGCTGGTAENAGTLDDPQPGVANLSGC